MRHYRQFYLLNLGMPPLCKSVEHHIKSDDYFVTLATTLDLLHQLFEHDSQTLQQLARQHAERADTLRRLREELLWLQRHYLITKRRAAPLAEN